jgi:hypothetical protein
MKYTEKKSTFQLCFIWINYRTYIEHVKQLLRLTEMLPSIKYITFIVIIDRQKNRSNEYASLINQ